MRYALSFSPSVSSQLFQAGSHWLGRNTYSGENISQPQVQGISADRLWELTSYARYYGLQAVIRFPFRLAAEVTLETFFEELEKFAVQQTPLVVSPLKIDQDVGVFYLETEHLPNRLLHLTGDAVKIINRLSAPLTPSEYARLKAGILSTQEKQNLQNWGYPYVFNQYRFRIWLTSHINHTAEKEVIYSALNRYFSATCADPLMIDAISLFVENGPGEPLRFFHRFLFTPHPSEEEKRQRYANNTTKNIHSGYQRSAP